MPSGPNRPSQPLASPDSYATSSGGEKNPLDNQNIDQESARPGVEDAKEGFWRPHYSVSLGYISAILVMTIWPWVFYGVVRHNGGIKMATTTANAVQKHPQATDFIVTALASAIAWLAGYLFSTSVTTLSRLRVVFEETDVFRISFFSALKHRAFVWPVGTLPFLCKSWARVRLVLALLLYIIIFILVTPGMTAFLHPQTFSRQSNLTATEPDFASSNPDCVNWYKTLNTFVDQSCGWNSYHGFQFTTCFGENQLVDALDSGRSNILSLLPHTTESFFFPQLGGTHLLGPIRGVMPIGPNGIPVFGNLSTWPSAASAIPNSYNYTLNLQGFKSDVTCAYSSDSIVSLQPSPNHLNWAYFNATCPPGKEILMNPTYIVPSLPAVTNNSFGFWACLTSEPQDLQESYEIYLYGLPGGAYGNMTGNITCSLPAMQSAVFPVKYANQTNFFNLEDPLSVSTNLSTALMRNAIIGIGNVIWGAQDLVANSVAESVITFGVREYNLTVDLSNYKFLQIYAAMIQGLLEYEATYIRLLSSTDVITTLAPSGCLRDVTGWVEYPVIGWQFRRTTAAYLIPLTIVNLTSLLFFLITLFTLKMLPSFDPTNPVSLMVASSGRDLHNVMQPVIDPADPEAWKHLLKYDQIQGRFAVLPEA
jgi:hypothetical protein